MAVELTADVVTVINLAAFFAFLLISGILVYLGRSTHAEKKVTFPWVNLAFGTVLIGINYLIQAIFATRLTGDPTITISSYLLIVGGAALSFTSFVTLYVERTHEVSSLQKRQDELKEITERLKKKFLSREIPEDEMKKLNTDIVRELAEVEVKLDKLTRKTSSSR